MVGVPRSQGCRNCRRKKKGCDLKRPSCGQCERLNIPCGYDEQRWTFVPQRTSEAGSSSSTAAIERRDSSELLGAMQSLTVATQPLSMRRTALQVQTDAVFWTLYMPRGEPGTFSTTQVIGTGSWVETIRFIASQDETARLALDACAAMALGRFQDNETLAQQGTRFYIWALHEVNKALQNPRRASSDGILAACRILGLCEIFRSDNGNGVSTRGTDWQRHVEGTVRLLQLRGAERHTDGHAHTLFVEGRISAAVSAVTRRRSPALSDPSWTSIPWTRRPRSLRDELVDAMVSVAHLLQAQDTLLDGLVDPSVLRDMAGIGVRFRDMFLRSKQIGDSLELWEQKAIRLSSQMSGASAATGTLEDNCMRHGYEFFNTIMRYWFICMILTSRTWLLFRRISQIIPPSAFTSAPGGLPGVPDPQRFAANIARNCHHYFDAEAGLWGAQNASLSMGGALHYYAATGQFDSPGMTELRRVLREYKGAQFTVGFLKSMAADPAPEGLKGDTSVPQEHIRMAANWFGLDRIAPAGVQ